MRARKTASKAVAKAETADVARVAAASSPQGAASANVLADRYGEAYADLARSLQEDIVAAQAQQCEAYAAYEKARDGVNSEALRRAGEAYENYLKAAPSSTATEKGQKEFEEAYRNYAATLTGLQEEALSQFQKAYQDWASAVARIATDGQGRTRQQYLDYLGRLQRAWAGVDVSSLV